METKTTRLDDEPRVLRDMMKRVSKMTQQVTGIDCEDFNEHLPLGNYPNQYMGWHSDGENDIKGSIIAAISFGGQATMSFGLTSTFATGKKITKGVNKGYPPIIPGTLKQNEKTRLYKRFRDGEITEKVFWKEYEAIVKTCKAPDKESIAPILQFPIPGTGAIVIQRGESLNTVYHHKVESEGVARLVCTGRIMKTEFDKKNQVFITANGKRPAVLGLIPGDGEAQAEGDAEDNDEEGDADRDGQDDDEKGTDGPGRGQGGGEDDADNDDNDDGTGKPGRATKSRPASRQVKRGQGSKKGKQPAVQADHGDAMDLDDNSTPAERQAEMRRQLLEAASRMSYMYGSQRQKKGSKTAPKTSAGQTQADGSGSDAQSPDLALRTRRTTATKETEAAKKSGQTSSGSLDQSKLPQGTKRRRDSDEDENENGEGPVGKRAKTSTARSVLARAPPRASARALANATAKAPASAPATRGRGRGGHRGAAG